jgi:hypothetical protein
LAAREGGYAKTADENVMHGQNLKIMRPKNPVTYVTGNNEHPRSTRVCLLSCFSLKVLEILARPMVQGTVMRIEDAGHCDPIPTTPEAALAI